MKEKCRVCEIENTCTNTYCYTLAHWIASELFGIRQTSLFHPSLVSQMAGLWTRMELRRCIRPSVLVDLWHFKPFSHLKNIPQAAVRQELFAKFHEVIGSTGAHSWFCLHVQMVLLLVHYFTLRGMFSSFSWQFSWSHQLFCFKKNLQSMDSPVASGIGSQSLWASQGLARLRCRRVRT